MTGRPRHVPEQDQAWPGTDSELSPPADHGETSWTGRDRLRGKRAVITGGDSGIGRAVAVTFAKEGADVLIAHLPQEQSDAEETAELVRAQGRSVVLHAGDLRTADAARKLADRAVNELGGCDVLVCNAAFQMAHQELQEFPTDQIERTFATNVFGTFWLIQALAPQLEDGGSVIVTTSVQAYSPSDHLLDYAATKAALNNLVQTAALELAPDRIRVNAIAPASIDTPLLRASFARTGDPEQARTQNIARHPLGRLGKAEEVAELALFLVSDCAQWITGSIYAIDGGAGVTRR